jgi:Polyketide cyclase / dehydrase and lipid transport
VSQVEGEIVIRGPVEEVFDFVVDERNEPHYNPRMLRAEKITDGPVGPDTRFLAELETLGHPMPMTVEFTDYDRPRRVTSCTRSSMMTTDGTLSFVPIPGGTLMRWSWDVRPHGILRLLGPLVGWLGRRQEQNIWGSLKRLLERAGGEAHGSSRSDVPGAR